MPLVRARGIDLGKDDSSCVVLARVDDGKLVVDHILQR